MADLPSVSIVVPTHQRRDSLLRLCDALSRQTAPASVFELVVSIDGSTDGTHEAVASRVSAYRTRVLSQVNRGRASAINAGVAAATGELIVLLDDDMEPSPGFVEAHRLAHAGDDRLGVMGAVPISIEAESSAASRYVAARFNQHLRNLHRPGYRLQLTDFFSGNFSIRRALLQEVGGFDEDFRLYGNEDLELSHRLADAGVRLQFDAMALARQHNDKEFAALARDSVAEGRTAVLFAEKHPDVFDHLKLGTFHHGPRSLRLIRNTLLALGQRWASLPDLIVRLEAILSRGRVPGMSAFYRLALGYFFWTGVRAELRERSPGERSDARLVRLAGELAR